MNVRVFYAWQSDTEGKHNHYLIRDAAEDACARITADTMNGWVVQLDHDTVGTPGMCDIPNTILEKITQSDIFLADLTLVGKTEDGKKSLPNSNVVFELGYAARQLGFEALIGVVNEHYGKVESQVFDIKRRACLKYSTEKATNKAELKKVGESLSKTIEAVIRTTIETVVLKKRQATAANDAATAHVKQAEVATKVMAGKFHDLSERPAILTSFFFAPHELDYEATVSRLVRERFAANPEVFADSYVWKRHGDTNEFSRLGYFHRACTRDYRSFLSQRLFLGDAPEPGQHLNAQPLVANLVRGILEMSAFLSALRIETPWQIAISLVGVRLWNLRDQSHQTGERPFGDEIVHLPIRTVASLEQVADPISVGRLLKPAIDYLTRTVGWEFNWFYTDNGVLNVRV